MADLFDSDSDSYESNDDNFDESDSEEWNPVEDNQYGGIERNAFERLAISSITDVVPDKVFTRAQEREVNRFVSKTINMVRDITNAINSDIGFGFEIDLSNDTVIDFIKKCIDIEHFETKNVNGLLLGYLATKKGRELTKESFNKIAYDLLPLLNDSDLSHENVLRYSRFWVRVVTQEQ